MNTARKMDPQGYMRLIDYVETCGVRELQILVNYFKNASSVTRMGIELSKSYEFSRELNELLIEYRHNLGMQMNHFLNRLILESKFDPNVLREYSKCLEKLKKIGITQIILAHGNNYEFKKKRTYISNENYIRKIFSGEKDGLESINYEKNALGYDVYFDKPAWIIDATVYKDSKYQNEASLTTKSLLLDTTLLPTSELQDMSEPLSFVLHKSKQVPRYPIQGPIRNIK